MKYIGVHPKSEFPGGVVHVEHDHDETHGAKVVSYYRVWVRAEGHIPPTFGEDLNVGKVRRMDNVFNNDKAKWPPPIPPELEEE